MALPPDLVCLADFKEYARNHLPKYALDYYLSGAMEEQTLRENVNAFRRLRIHPRVLRGISEVDMSTTVLGQTISMPICIAPTAIHKMAHPSSEIATAKAVQTAGTLMAMSCWASSNVADVASAASDCLLWLNTYIFCDRDVTIRLLRKAEKSGCQAVVLTVDAPIVGRKLSDLRNKMPTPLSHFKYPNVEYSDEEETVKPGSTSYIAYLRSSVESNLNWSNVDWLTSESRLPIILKGILTTEDAKQAVEHGAAGIIVSNHGGRQLDTVPAMIEVLPEIVEAVQGRAEVYLDGGVRLGTDVFKALALGARAVFIGRPVLWGLAYQVADQLQISNHQWCPGSRTVHNYRMQRPSENVRVYLMVHILKMIKNLHRQSGLNKGSIYIYTNVAVSEMDKKLSPKQKNCVVRNNIIQKNAKDATRGLASEQNEFKRRMNVEARKLLMRFTKTAEIKHDNDKRRYELCQDHPPSPKLPVIHHPEEDSRSDDIPVLSRSAPGSPCGLARRKTLQPLSHDGATLYHSLSPPKPPLPGIRRGSCPDLDKLDQLMIPTRSRRGSTDQTDVPRNLARRRSRRGSSSLNELQFGQADVAGTTTPSLEEQFQALSSCRYLRD